MSTQQSLKKDPLNEAAPAYDFQIVKEGQPSKTIAFDREKVLIGRMPQNQIILDDASVSRTHAMIKQTKGKFFVVDQGSQNGTLINGRVVLQGEFKPGDILTIGAFSLKIIPRQKK